MAGISATTLRPIPDRAHLAQSIETLLTTWIGERVMREWVGTPENGLIGQNISDRDVLRWWTITWMVLDIFEPRIRNLRLVPRLATSTGTFEAEIFGHEVLTGHLGFQQARLFVSIKNNTVTVTDRA
jgi:phage baseplate assembly protein W